VETNLAVYKRVDSKYVVEECLEIAVQVTSPFSGRAANMAWQEYLFRVQHTSWRKSLKFTEWRRQKMTVLKLLIG